MSQTTIFINVEGVDINALPNTDYVHLVFYQQEEGKPKQDDFCYTGDVVKIALKKDLLKRLVMMAGIYIPKDIYL